VKRHCKSCDRWLEPYEMVHNGKRGLLRKCKPCYNDDRRATRKRAELSPELRERRNVRKRARYLLMVSTGMLPRLAARSA